MGRREQVPGAQTAVTANTGTRGALWQLAWAQAGSPGR